MPSTFEFCEPTALAAGIEALFVQGKLLRPMSMAWADFGPRALARNDWHWNACCCSRPLSSVACGYRRRLTRPNSTRALDCD